MEKRTKRVRILGKGHSSCVSSLLYSWYQEKKFQDVTLTCVTYLESQDGDIHSHIQANRSVLAAASSVFATLFLESPLVEEDLQVFLIGYDYEIVKNIVEYVYTGSLEFVFSNNEKIETFLKDFKIKLPEVTRNYVVEDVTDSSLVASITQGDFAEFIGPDFPSSENQEIESAASSSTTVSAPKSNFSTTNKRNQDTFVTQKRLTQASSTLAKNSFQRASILPNADTGGRATKQIHNPTLKHRSNSSAFNTDHSSNLLPAGVVVFELEPTTGNVQRVMLDKNRGPSTAVTSRASTTKHYVNKSIGSKQSTTPFTYKVLHRTISAPINKKQVVTLDTPSTQGQFGLFKSFPEKTIQQPGNVFNQLPKPEVTEKAKSATEESARVKNYRAMIHAFYDVPGTYTLYRERPVYFVESYYAPLEMIGDHVYFPSFLKNPQQLRTYQERPLVRSEKGTLRNLSLLGVRIDSIHQVGNQVHIRTVGEPLVNKESEALFYDSPSHGLNPLQLATQLCVEHNYSYGETELKENEGIEMETNSLEMEEDVEDYKRALQLTINEQRRKNRLKMRIQSQEKEIKIMRKKARNLIKFCHDLNEEAHDIDPEFFEKTRELMDSSDMAEPMPKKGRVEPDPKPNPMIPCEVCNKLIKESWMKRHLLIAHSAERNWMCDECGRTFVLKGQLKAHQKRQHETQPGNYLCEECGRSFRFIRYLKRHMSLHRGDKPHVCRYCDKAFRLKPVLIKHVRTHTGEKPYECTVCGKCFRQRTTYANHLKVHEKRREAVQKDGTVLATGATNPPERLKCDFCSMTFRLDLFMMLHRSKHTGEIPALPCPTCSMTFPSIKELSLHRKNEHPDTVYACKICPKIFTNKANFDFHVQRHTNPDLKRKKYGTIDNSGPATCEFCNKVFSSRSGLDYHIKGIHLGEKSMKCQFCDKTFSHRPTMEQHMRIHTGERPYKCDQCPSAFKQNQHLAAHMVIHTGERPFGCEHCDKTFPHKTTLYTHMRIHTGNRLLCTYCSKILPSLAQLQRHEDECAMNELNQ